VSQGPFGTLCAVAIQALAYLTGNFDREGGLLFQPWSAALGLMLRFARQPSRVGAYTPNAGGLPGGILADEILTPGPERIRALIVLSGNPLTSMPDERRLREAFRHLYLLVTIDMFTNETGREAHLVLPATSWLERADLSGWNAAFVQASFIDSTPAMRPPPGEARPEWRIFADLSLAAGRPLLGWATRPARTVPFDRVIQPLANLVALPFRRMMRSAQGVPWRRPRGGAYLRGRRRVRFWSAELEGEPLRLETHATDSIAALADRSTFVLLCRRRRFAQNSWIHGGTRDGNSEAYASLCPADMKRLDLERDDPIELQSAAGAIRIPVRADEGVMAGTVVVPHGLPGVNVNRLIGSDHSLIEPLSGMHRMSGHRVVLRTLRPS
jgi:anaerobic selenocysteine-containing dehydrogenase